MVVVGTRIDNRLLHGIVATSCSFVKAGDSYNYLLNKNK